MRTPHYWKKAGPSAAPSNIIIVDTETWHGDAVCVGSVEYHRLRIGVSKAVRLEGGNRTRERTIRFTEAGHFWEFFVSRLSKHRPLWLFGHNLGYDLGILSGWNWLLSSECKVSKCVLEGALFFVKGQYNGLPFWFCDTFNYYRSSLEVVGKAMGIRKPDLPSNEDSDEAWYKRCEADVEITLKAVESLVKYGKSVGLGPWQPTIAAQSFACYRSKYMKAKTLVHCNWPALKLERASYYGGIVDNQFIGKVEKVHELDVCSMYPYVCTFDLPTKLVGYSDRVGPDVLNHLAKRYLCFGDVTIKTDKEVYPVRHKKKVYYPIGEYRTQLAHPELMAALLRGHVKYIHAASWHEKAPIFREYMQDLVAQKQLFREPGSENEAFSTVAKMLVTNLYGKTGQLTPKWSQWNEESLEKLATMNGLKRDALEVYANHPPKPQTFEGWHSFVEFDLHVKVRCLYGTTELQVGEFESRDSVPSIASCVTSYARMLLRSMQAIAGQGNWFYSDTDSIWTNTIGARALEQHNLTGKGILGRLDSKACHQWAEFFGPKDYRYPGGVKLKGIRKPDENCNGAGYSQVAFPSAKVQLSSGLEGVVAVVRTVKHLSRTITRVHVDPSGWTRPLVFPLSE